MFFLEQNLLVKMSYRGHMSRNRREFKGNLPREVFYCTKSHGKFFFARPCIENNLSSTSVLATEINAIVSKI